MRQNRVDPFGNIIAVPDRGRWLGNRGVIHVDEKVVRPYRLKAWITCVLEFKNRKFKIMAPGRWTQLFFMDEATALSAGHRPCCECRRADFMRFKAAWIAGNPGFAFGMKTRIGEIDSILHDERLSASHDKCTFKAFSKDLPDGVFITIGGQSHLIFRNALYPWSPGGYLQPIPLPENEEFTVLTPYSIVQAIRSGYLPQISLQ